MLSFLLLLSFIHKQQVTGFQTVISRIVKAVASADLAHSSNHTKSQIAYSIYDGRYNASRPRTSVAPPVQLFHPAFGHVLDNVKSNHTLPGDIIRQTAEYMKAASAIYESEETRRKELTPVLCAILDVNIETILNEDKTGLIFLQQDRNEFGDGGSDPSTQAGLFAGRCWARPGVRQI